MGIQQIPLASSGLSASDLVTEPNWELISEYKNSSAVNSITISSIPQTYRKIKLVWNALRQSTATQSHQLRINGDSGSNYGIQGFYWYDQPHQGAPIMQSAAGQFLITNSSVGNSYRSSAELEFPNYSTTDPKLISGKVGWFDGSGVAHHSEFEGLYRSGSSTNAITSLTIFSGGAGTIYTESAWNMSTVILLGAK